MGPGLLRLLLAMLVIAHHSTPLRLGAFAVYVFFILSGYWIAVMWDSKYSRTECAYWTFMVSRYWRLIPIFLCCMLLGVISALILGNIVPNPSASLEWWIRQLPIMGSSSAGVILAPSWSIDVEMQFYMVAPMLVLVSNRWNAVGCWLLFAGSTVWFIVPRLSGDFENLPYGWLYLAFFSMGVLLHRTGWRAGQKLAWGVFLSACIIIIAVITYPQTRSLFWIIGSAVRNETLPQSIQIGRWFSNLAGAFLMVPFLSWNVRQKSDGFDREVGNLSYPLYLFHWIPREWYYHYVNWTLPAWKNAILLFGNFVVTFVGAWLILRWIDRPLEIMRKQWVSARLKKSVPAQRILAGADGTSKN